MNNIISPQIIEQKQLQHMPMEVLPCETGANMLRDKWELNPPPHLDN